jgi:hypothetical protein
MNSVVLCDSGEVWTWGEPWGDFMTMDVQRAPRKVRQMLLCSAEVQQSLVLSRTTACVAETLCVMHINLSTCRVQQRVTSQCVVSTTLFCLMWHLC